MTDELIEIVRYALELKTDSHCPNCEYELIANDPYDCAKAALQAIQSSGTFMVVPVEPTEAMLADGGAKNLRRGIYKAMLDACK